MPSSFDKCLETEKKSIEIIKLWIKNYPSIDNFILMPNGKDALDIQQYGDLALTIKGVRCFVELKAEYENKYGNLFIETWSNKSRFNPGWIYKTKADKLFYHFLDTEQLFISDMPVLKEYLFCHKSGIPRIASYKEKPQSKHQQMNDTWGACVPIIELIDNEAIKEFSLKINNKEPS